MSNDNEKSELITNEDTLVRRAWIDSALDSVRSRLGGTPGGEDAPDAENGNAEPENTAKDRAAAMDGLTSVSFIWVGWFALRVVKKLVSQ